jgi:hypothetical protein
LTWQTEFLTGAFDAAAVCCALYVVWRYAHARKAMRESLPGAGLLVAGISFFGVFHAADLVAMSILPHWIGADLARAWMSGLHLEIGWIAKVCALAVLAGGFGVLV